MDDKRKTDSPEGSGSAVDQWSEISYFAWQRRPDAAQSPNLFERAWARGDRGTFETVD